MQWLQSHWPTLFGAWSVSVVLAQVVSAKAPPTTWYGKAAHAWAGFNPFDLVKVYAAAKASAPEVKL